MTTGNWLYLLMAIGMFSALSGMLAYQSWQQSSSKGPEVVNEPAQPNEPDHTVTV
jgi:hypothetical protein